MFSAKLASAARQIGVGTILCGHTHSFVSDSEQGIRFDRAGSACCLDADDAELETGIQIVNLSGEPGRIDVTTERFRFCGQCVEFVVDLNGRCPNCNRFL